MSDNVQLAHEPLDGHETKRDFIYIATGTFLAVGAAATTWPLINSMNPGSDVLSVSTIELSLSPIQPGQRVTISWRGQPVFIDRRTPERIAAARTVELSALPDPQTDEARTSDAEWLIVVGVCTHLGCVPLGQGQGDPLGDWGGWFCPCHGSHYDTSGRIRKGPAPSNLVVPPYKFTDKSTVTIG